MTRPYTAGPGVERPWERMALVLLVAGVGAVVLLLVDRVVPVLGHRVPQDDVGTDYKVGFLWAVALGVSVLVWPVSNADKRALLVVWLAKMAVALGVMLFAESYYEGVDAFFYFAWPQRPGVRWPGFAFGEGTENILALSWLHQMVIPDSYHAMKVSFAMAGLVAVYVLYRAGVRFLGREDVRVLYLLALCPSVLYWSSIIGKDPVILLGVGLYVYGVVGFHADRSSTARRVGYAVVLVAGVALASLIRVWLGPILLAPLAVFVLVGVRNVLAKVLVVAVVAGAFVYALALANETFEVESTTDLIERADHISHSAAAGSSSEGGSSLEVARIRDWKTMVEFAPLGAFTALFRPLPGEVLNPFGLLASLENVGLLALLLRGVKRARWRDVRQPLVLWAIAVLLIWSLVYGFASIQNLGAAVRWKLQILPLFVGLLCYLGRRRA